MIIVWAVVIAVTLVVEFITVHLISVWFSVGGIAALIAAACGAASGWQVLIFFVVSLVFILSLRRLTVKFLKTKTTPTNLDANIGMKVKLLKDVADNTSEIKILDTVWTVSCEHALKSGDEVEITGMAGSKYIVRDINNKEETK